MTTDTRDLTAVLSDSGFCIGHRSTDRPGRFVGAAVVWHQQADPGIILAGSTFPTDLTPRVTIPGGTLRPGSSLRVSALYATGEPGSKTAQIVIGNTAIADTFTIPATSQAAYHQRDAWVTVVDTVPRLITFPGGAQHDQTTTAQVVNNFFDWTQDQPIFITGKLSRPDDWMAVRAWRVELFPAE